MVLYLCIAIPLLEKVKNLILPIIGGEVGRKRDIYFLVLQIGFDIGCVNIMEYVIESLVSYQQSG